MKKDFSIRLFSFLYLTLFILFFIIGIVMIFFDDKQLHGIQCLITSSIFGFSLGLMKTKNHIILFKPPIAMLSLSLLMLSVISLSLQNNIFAIIALGLIALMLFISLIREIIVQKKQGYEKHI